MDRSLPLPEATTRLKTPRSLHFAVFAIGLLWLLASQVGAESAAQGISRLIQLPVLRPLLQRCFLLILLVTGYTALNWVALRNGGLRSTNGLPARPTAATEWQKGAAVGWAGMLIAILPAICAGDLHPIFWFAPRAWGLSLLALMTVLVGALATEVAFRGFLFKRLISVMGPTSATVVLAAIYALVATPLANSTGFSFLVSVVSAVVLSVAYLRTHGLWLGWGLRFGWLAAMGVLFGLPVGGSAGVANVVATESLGPAWLSGGAYGPEGALVTALVLLAGVFAVYRLTRDYAWEYTHEAIVSGGYPMDVPPPAAHAAMEGTAAPPPLVQILGAVPVTQLLPPRPSAPVMGIPPPPPVETPRVAAEQVPSTDVDRNRT